MIENIKQWIRSHFFTKTELVDQGALDSRYYTETEITASLSLYALLAGRAAGQTLKGGTASGDDLTLMSTAHATKGNIFFGTSTYDEVNNRLGIGNIAPAAGLQVTKTTGSNNVATLTGSAGATEVDQYGNMYVTGTNAAAGCVGTGVVSFRINDTGNKDWRIETVRTAPAGSLEFTNLTDAASSPRLILAPDGNIAIGGVGSFGSGVKVIFIVNATTVPTTNPTGGGILYTEAGALKYRGSSGTVSTLGVA